MLLIRKYFEVMARVTVEDCVEQITNRFELVSLAAQRAKSISYSGHNLKIFSN